MEQSLKSIAKRVRLHVLLTVLVVFGIFLTLTYNAIAENAKAEAHARYVGIMNIASEKIGKTIRGMEMNAMNEFDEVEKHLDSPESVIAALESKTSLNPEVRGYFAAFEPDYFPQRGQWFEPYVHHVDSGNFEMRQVGGARHNYHKSAWYVRAKQSSASFWSDPYYYYDGTNISGHYTTFVKPVFDAKGRLACVCGADMTFEWITKELLHIDAKMKNNDLMNRYHKAGQAEFYTVVINNDGSCIAGPEGKKVVLSEASVKRDLMMGKSGVLELTLNGEPSKVYYGPIEHVDWAVAVVVPVQNVRQPLIGIGIMLLVAALLGMAVVWFVCGKLKNVETL